MFPAFMMFRERLDMHQSLLEAKQENERLLSTAADVKDQLEVYRAQCEEAEKRGGEAAKPGGHFRKEMDRLAVKLRTVEGDMR